MCRLSALRITPIVNAPIERVADVAAATGERRAADDHGRDRVELGEVARRRRAAVDQAGGEQPADARGEAAQHVDGDEHAARRDARRAAPPPDCRRRRTASGPRPSRRSGAAQAAAERRPRRRSSTAASRSSRRRCVWTIGGMPGTSVPSETQSAIPRTMLSVASVTMNGCGTRPKTKTRPLTAPTASRCPRIAAITSERSSWCRSKTTAPTTPESAIVAPTERSMPRVTITSSWPSATTRSPRSARRRCRCCGS